MWFTILVNVLAIMRLLPLSAGGRDCCVSVGVRCDERRLPPSDAVDGVRCMGTGEVGIAPEREEARE